MLELIRLYASLCFSPGKLLRVRSRHRVFAIGERPDHIPFTDCVRGGVEHVRTLDDIAWSNILRRRIRVINRPSRLELKSPEQKKKAKGLKLLFLSLKKAGALCRFQEAVFSPALSQKHRKLIFLPDKAGKDIFAWHFPDWHVLEFKDDSGWLEGRLFSLAARWHEEKLRDLSEGVTVFVNVFSPLLLRTYHRIHPNRRLVVRLYDCLKGAQLSKAPKLGRMFRALLDEGVIAEAESYFRRDAELLGILYRPNGASPEAMRRLRRDDRACLWCFLGGGVKKDGRVPSRLRDLESVKTEILSIYPKAQSWIREQLVTGGVSSQWLSYPDYVRLTSQAEVCVDLIRTSQDEGFSYRIPEALWLNQKIITNRRIVRDEPFYDPDRVFIIGVDSLSRLRSFLEKDVPPLSPEILRLYDSSLWWTERDPFGVQI